MTNLRIHHMAIVMGLLTGISTLCQAQKLVDKRDQATGWYVPVNVKVTAEGGRARNLDITVYKENTLVNHLESKKGTFTLNLDLDNSYTFIVEEDGYRRKSVVVDTHVPAQQVEYAAFPCFVNLEAADKFTHSDPFFMDFPSAIIRWDTAMEGFVPNMGYVADIQSKIGMLQAQMSPN